MSENLPQTANEKISDMVEGKFNPQQIAAIKSKIAKNVTDPELAIFLLAAATTGLNPIMGEIWCYKNGTGGLIIFAGRDGLLTAAQKKSYWNGIFSFAFYENEVFSISFKKNVLEINHEPINDPTKRGRLLGAYAIARPQGAEITTCERVDFSTYDKGQFTWKSFPEAMIKKVAESHCLKKAYAIPHIQVDEDFIIEKDVAIPITDFEVVSDIDVLTDKITKLFETYKDTDKEEIRSSCNKAKQNGTFDIDFAKKTIQLLGGAE